MDDLGNEQIARYDAAESGMSSHGNKYTGSYAYAYQPNTDALAANGVTFTQLRVCSICSPTRASALVGKDMSETGLGGITRVTNKTRSFTEFMNQTTPPLRTIFQLLADEDVVGVNDSYASFWVGKHHLYSDRIGINGQGSGLFEDDQGSDVYHATAVMGVGTWEGCPRNLEPFDPENSPWSASYMPFTGVPDATGYRWWDGTAMINPALHATQRTQARIRNYAVEQIQAGNTDKYFGWGAFNGPGHSPFEFVGSAWHNFGTDAGTDGDAATGDPNINPGTPQDRTFGPHINTRVRSQIEVFDFWLGQMLTTIGAEFSLPSPFASNAAAYAAEPDFPVIMLWGDNGTDSLAIDPAADGTEFRYPVGHPNYSAGDETPGNLSLAPYDSTHFKGSLFEQGIRVPLIVFGPAVHSSRRGGECHKLVDVTDFMATWLDLADVSLQNQQKLSPKGVSFRPYFGGPFPIVVTLEREVSYISQYNPNGIGANYENKRESFIRRDGTLQDNTTGAAGNANLWKLIREKLSGVQQTDRFYNVGNPIPTFATGTIEITAVPTPGGGNLNIQDSANSLNIAFVPGPGGPTDVDVSSTDTETVASDIATIINASALTITAVATQSTVTLTQTVLGVAQNIAMEGPTGLPFPSMTLVGMSGGLEPDPLETINLGPSTDFFDAFEDEYNATVAAYEEHIGSSPSARARGLGGVTSPGGIGSIK